MTRSPLALALPIALLVLLLQPAPVGADALGDIENEFEKAIRKVSPSTVVCVPAGVKASPTKRPGSSSGIIISRKGYVLSDGDVGVWYEVTGQGRDRKITTNDSDKIEIRLPDLKGRGSRSYEARVLVRDRKLDTSLLRITKPPTGLKHLAVGNSDKLQVGDFAFSMGDSFGLAAEAPPTLTAGLISALVPAEDKSVGLYDMIFTSAAVNVGVNGGPLVDIEGRLIGVVSGPESPWDPKTRDAKRPFQFLGRVVPIKRLKAFYKNVPEAEGLFDDASGDRPRSRKAAILETVFHETGKRAYRGLVSLDVQRNGDAEFREIFALGRRGLGRLQRYSGPVSGILLSDDGWILTSIYNLGNTVGIVNGLPDSAPPEAKLGVGLAGIARIVAHLPDGREVEAEIVGRHDGIGVALLKTKKPESGAERAYGANLLKPVPPDYYETGRIVLAVANPYGAKRQDDPLLTFGILSKLHPEDSGTRWAGQWQTDCSGTDATAGGAVVDLAGRLVGMMHIWDPGRHGRNSGISFVVPWGQIEPVLDDLKQGRVFSPPFVGVRWQPDASGEGLKILSVVKGGPAETAGIKKDDVIEQIDGQALNNPGDAGRLLKGKWSGDVVKLTVRRGDKTLEIEVTLGSRVDPPKPS
ncbi:MAG: trypsin-like peptidase domain-containing protein [Planctomycetota bacterium]|nr:trypsin-like peptidase domain-containing protein [Planctomycetota bacterium]